MKVHVFYHFLNENDFEFFEQEKMRFPENIRENINLYKEKDDRNLRIVSKLLLEKAVAKIFPDEKNILEKLKKTLQNQSYLENLNVSFSISHSEKLCAVAISEHIKIGIDSEFIKPIDLALFNDFLHPLEIEFLNKSENPEIEFLKIWTKKEAVLKATGKGVSDEINQMDSHLKQIKYDGQVFYLKEIPLSENYVVNLVSTANEFELIFEEIKFN